MRKNALSKLRALFIPAGRNRKFEPTPSRREFLEISRRFQDRFRRPNKTIGNAGPKRYSQLFISTDRADSQKWWFSLGDYLEHEVPDAKIAHVELERYGVAKHRVVIHGHAASFVSGEKTSQPQANVVRDFKRFSKSIANVPREKSHRNVSAHMFKDHCRLKGKKRNRVSA